MIANTSMELNQIFPLFLHSPKTSFEGSFLALFGHVTKLAKDQNDLIKANIREYQWQYNASVNMKQHCSILYYSKEKSNDNDVGDRTNDQ